MYLLILLFIVIFITSLYSLRENYTSNNDWIDLSNNMNTLFGNAINDANNFTLFPL